MAVARGLGRDGLFRLRRHADWLVDDGYTDDYLRAAATMLPETARVAYSTVGPRCTEVLGILADDVWIGRSETIVAALIEAPEEGGHESDERAVRSRLARGFMNPHLEEAAFLRSLAGAAVTDVAALVAAARAAVDAIRAPKRCPSCSSATTRGAGWRAPCGSAFPRFVSSRSVRSLSAS